MAPPAHAQPLARRPAAPITAHAPRRLFGMSRGGAQGTALVGGIIVRSAVGVGRSTAGGGGRRRPRNMPHRTPDHCR